MRCSRIVLIIHLLFPGLAAVDAQTATSWALPGWKYRAPVQVHNGSTNPCANSVVAIVDLPATLLISEGKLAQSGADFRLVDEKGNALPLRAEQLLSDVGDARLILTLDNIPAKSRRILWLYYGNPHAQAGTVLSAKSTGEMKEVTVSVGAEESVQPAALVNKTTLTQWLKDHKLIEAETGRREGFIERRAGRESQSASGAVIVASGGPGDKVTFDLDLEPINQEVSAPSRGGNARRARSESVQQGLRPSANKQDARSLQSGQYVCWVRYATALPGQTPQGTLTLSLQGEGLKPVIRVEQCDTPAAYRWIPLAITLPSEARLRLAAEAKSSSASLDCIILTTDLNYQPDYRDFIGRVWVRWRIDQPEGYRYSSSIESEIDPYKPAFLDTGDINPFGLQTNKSGMPFRTDEDYFRTGQYSPWVLLPTSRSRQWHSVLFFSPKDESTLRADMTVRLEFANRPSPERIFHITPAEPIEMKRASLGVRMPTTVTLGGLKQLETFMEWSKRRLALVEELHLSPPPHLNKLKVGTWVSLATRVGQGTGGAEMAEIAFRGLEALGVNTPSIGGVEDAVFGEMSRQHGMIGTSWTSWAANGEIVDGKGGKFDYKEGETMLERWERLLDDQYRNNADRIKTESPNTFNAAIHINLGDEIGQIVTAAIVAKTPQGLAYFRDWLKRHGQTPADFGAKSWDEVMPMDDRKGIGGDGTPTCRLFYWSRQFINDCTAQYYRFATRAVRKYFPKAELIAVNYQAAPMGAAFIGNGNDMDRETLDFFHFGRIGAFEGVMMEDWVDGCDFGVGAEGLASEMMRAAGRKFNSPLASYLVGGEAIRGEFYGFLMHGIKENGLYLYGPISNIGPAWGEDPRALKELAEVTREVKKFEDAIADGVIRRRRAAMLIATTSDYMQKLGVRFCGERQLLYVALQHAGLPVDVVCEEDIVEDEILKHYDLLYITDPQVRDGTLRKVADWVKTGGKLWACVGAADWNEYNQPSSILNDVFGVSKRQMLTQDDCLPTAKTQAPGAKNQWAYNLQVGTVKANSPMFGGEVEISAWGQKLDAEPTTAQVIGRYDDGKPAVFLNTYGKGQALLIGATVARTYKHDHYPNGRKEGKGDWSFSLGAPALRIVTALAAGIPRPVTLSLPGIYTSVMDSPQGTLVFLNNATLCAETDMTGALKPEVTVTVPITGKVTEAESAKLGKRDFTVKNGVVSFALPLPNADVILLRN